MPERSSAVMSIPLLRTLVVTRAATTPASSTHVGGDVCGRAFATEKNGERDGWVEMGAGDVAAGENHDHQRTADGDGGEITCEAEHRGAAYREDEEKCADEFRSVLIHGSFIVCRLDNIKCQMSGPSRIEPGDRFSCS